MQVSQAMIDACRKAIVSINGPEDPIVEVYDELALARTARYHMLMDHTTEDLINDDVYHIYYAFAVVELNEQVELIA